MSRLRAANGGLRGIGRQRRVRCSSLARGRASRCNRARPRLAALSAVSMCSRKFSRMRKRAQFPSSSLPGLTGKRPEVCFRFCESRSRQMCWFPSFARLSHHRTGHFRAITRAAAAHERDLPMGSKVDRCSVTNLAGRITQMRVRVVRKLADWVDGIDLSQCTAGDLIDLAERQARIMIAERWAVFARRAADPLAAASGDAVASGVAEGRRLRGDRRHSSRPQRAGRDLRVHVRPWLLLANRDLRSAARPPDTAK